MSDTVSTSKPVTRVRIQHSHTLKEGWRLTETTVEWTGDEAPDWESIRSDLMSAHIYGTKETENRRAIESGDQE